jgi:hypothetical protein
VVITFHNFLQRCASCPRQFQHKRPIGEPLNAETAQ